MMRVTKRSAFATVLAGAALFSVSATFASAQIAPAPLPAVEAGECSGVEVGGLCIVDGQVVAVVIAPPEDTIIDLPPTTAAGGGSPS